MSKYTKKRAVIVLLVFLCLIAVCIAISYLPALSHLEMIFRILPQTILYLFLVLQLHIHNHTTTTKKLVMGQSM